MAQAFQATPKRARPASPVTSVELPSRLSASTDFLAQAVSTAAAPTSDPVQRLASFEYAYDRLKKAVPRKARVSVLRDMSAALNKALRQAEAEERAAAMGNVAPPSDNAAFMAQLRRQEKALRIADIAAGRLLTSAQLAENIGLSVQAVSAAHKARRFFVMPGPSGGSYYPAFFADGAYERKDLERVCKALGAVAGGRKWDFFTQPKSSLDGDTPLDAIARGKIDAVLVAVRGFLES